METLVASSARTRWMRQFFFALDEDDALRPELLPDVGVIPFAVEFRVGQDQPACAKPQTTCFPRPARPFVPGGLACSQH